MAAHKEKGAKEALKLLRNADRVSSVCNDVVGDICGIVSGATGAVIVARLQTGLDLESVLISVGVTALISGAHHRRKGAGKALRHEPEQAGGPSGRAGFCICFIAAESLLIHTAAGGHCDSGFHSFP